MTQQKSQLHKTLWDIANTLRGNMGADEDEKANLRGKWGDSDHFEDVAMWFADNIKPFYNGTFPIWSKIQSELK